MGVEIAISALQATPARCTSAGAGVYLPKE